MQRVPPQNLDAERAALGAMLMGSDSSHEAITKAIETLSVTDFYRTGHQKIYVAIRGLFDKGEKVDLITVSEELRRIGEIDTAGGSSYVASLIDEIPMVANMDEYARIIRDKATMRRLMEVGSSLFGRASEDSMAVEELLNNASQILYEISQKRFSGGLQPLKNLVLPEIEKVEALAARAGTEADMLTGLPTGYHWLDQLTSGLQAGELNVVAARPGMGKTSFALNIAEHVAMVRKVPVLIFSMEMSAHALVRRLLCSHARVDSQSVRRGQLYDEDRGKLYQAASVLNELPIFIDESSRLTPLEMRARARRIFGEAHVKEGDGLIIVDYLQLMDYGAEGFSSRVENRQQEITAISRSAKAIAKELNVPVMMLSQLSRAPERREVSKPRLSDLRESGAIEQDADVVVFIWRDPKDAPEGGEESGGHGIVTRISVAKQRNGPTGSFPLYFNRAYTRFDHLETSQIQPDED
jgi:replicative DNA helicase